MANAAEPSETFWAAPHPQCQEGPGRVWNRAGWAGEPQLSSGLDRDHLCCILGGLGGAGKAQRLWLGRGSLSWGQSLNPEGMSNGKWLCLMSIFLI